MRPQTLHTTVQTPKGMVRLSSVNNRIDQAHNCSASLKLCLGCARASHTLLSHTYLQVDTIHEVAADQLPRSKSCRAEAAGPVQVSCTHSSEH